MRFVLRCLLDFAEEELPARINVGAAPRSPGQ